jgi:hypothetical protein
MHFAPVVLPGPKGQESLAQGLPWVSQKKVSSREGARGRERACGPAGVRSLLYQMAPSGLILVGELTLGYAFLATSGRMIRKHP